MIIHGACHCGNVSYDLETGKSREDVTVRICRCDFCLRHRPRYWSDPAGTLDIQVEDADKLIRYRFGHGTADFAICAVCGVFCCAVTEVDGGYYAVTNLNLALDREAAPKETFLGALEEDESARTARRAGNWTPVISPWPL